MPTYLVSDSIRPKMPQKLYYEPKKNHTFGKDGLKLLHSDTNAQRSLKVNCIQLEIW